MTEKCIDGEWIVTNTTLGQDGAGCASPGDGDGDT